MDVNALFGEPTVALRGPWTQQDLVKIGPAHWSGPPLLAVDIGVPFHPGAAGRPALRLKPRPTSRSKI